MTKNIAIIGAGQLGSRHLQALAQLKEEVSLYIVDPSQQSLKTSKERFDVVNYYNKTLTSLNSIFDLPKNLEFVVIATNSKQRLTVLRELLNHAQVNNLLLEKFLFPNIEEFEQAQQLLNKVNTKAYVNCARKMWPNYKYIKSMLKSEKNLHFEVSGGEWNLASNAIHFLNLFLYFANENSVSIDTSLLDEKVSENKRKGYIELTGTLKITTPKSNTLVLISKSNCQEQHSIKIYSDNFEIEIYEQQEKYLVNGNEMEFRVHHQSSLTDIVYMQLYKRKECDLVDFITSTNEHLLLLKAFKSFLKGREGIIT